jgi:hypothetical protein
MTPSQSLSSASQTSVEGWTSRMQLTELLEQTVVPVEHTPG